MIIHSPNLKVKARRKSGRTWRGQTSSTEAPSCPGSATTMLPCSCSPSSGERVAAALLGAPFCLGGRYLLVAGTGGLTMKQTSDSSRTFP